MRHFSNRCFICSFLLPLLFLLLALPISSGNIPMCFSCAPFPIRPPTPPPTPCPESGRPQRHHSPLGDNRYKEGLGGLVAAAQCASPLGKEFGGESPAYPNPLQSSSPPPQTMKTLSVRIRMERCALTRGITVIKATPLHLCLSIRLSTYNVSLYTNFGIPSLSCCSLHLKNSC